MSNPQSEKLREAQALVAAAKKAERAAWEERWKTQQADPEWQRKQAERFAKSEERRRKIAIGKENRRLAETEALMKEIGTCPRRHWQTAIHEASHAVVYELLLNGVTTATIIPSKRKGEDSTEESTALGHVMSSGTATALGRCQSAAHRIAAIEAGVYGCSALDAFAPIPAIATPTMTMTAIVLMTAAAATAEVLPRLLRN